MIVNITEDRYEILLQAELLLRTNDYKHYLNVVFNAMFDVKDDYYIPIDTIRFIKQNKNDFWISREERTMIFMQRWSVIE